MPMRSRRNGEDVSLSTFSHGFLGKSIELSHYMGQMERGRFTMQEKMPDDELENNEFIICKRQGGRSETSKAGKNTVQENRPATWKDFYATEDYSEREAILLEISNGALTPSELKEIMDA